MKIPYSLLPNQMQNLKSNKISLRVWLSLHNTEIIRASGNISTDRLSMNVGKSIYTLENITRDILFIKDNHFNLYWTSTGTNTGCFITYKSLDVHMSIFSGIQIKFCCLMTINLEKNTQKKNLKKGEGVR